MNFDRTEEQQLLAESVRRFLARDHDFAARGKILASAAGHSANAWEALAAIGLMSLPFAPDYGGFGGGAVDLMGVMEAFGDALVVEPYLATVGLGAQFVARGGSGQQRQNILPAVIAGKLKMAFAHIEKEARYDLAHVATRATKVTEGFVLDGQKCIVLHGNCADQLVVSARTTGQACDTDGITLFLVDPKTRGVVVRDARTLDGMRAATIVFTSVRVGGDAVLGQVGDGLPLIAEVTDFATALVCAEAVGAIKSANDATLEYLKTRQQFGMPIGAFQALQHRMVDMVIAAEQAESMASLACAAVDTATTAQERQRVVSAAKVRVGQACRQVSQEAVQLHGGMGMTDELKISHTFRRLTMIAQQFGDVDHHLQRFAALDAVAPSRDAKQASATP